MTEKINDGGPAFPVLHSIDGNWVRDPREEYSGMSLRDWFASLALIAVDQGRAFKEAEATGTAPAKIMANSAYFIADAMLAARGGA